MRNKIDLTGRIFSRLKVKQCDNTKTNRTYYICQCICGNVISVAASQLLNGHTKSCGCLQKEKVYELNKNKKKCNQYDLTSQPYGVCYASNTGQAILFDKEDYDLIKDYCWRVDACGYVVTSVKNNLTGKYNQIIKLHRLLMSCPIDYVVDHMNTNKLDNQKHNLRVCRQNENVKNHNVSKTSKTGISGVNWNNANQNWRVRIGNINIGSYKNFDDAVKARKEAEEKYFGEYSYSNSMKGENL